MTSNKIFGRLLTTVCAAIVFVTSAHAALLGRDINGNAVAASDASSVFLYDTDLNITWLRDANVNGPMLWANANAWANGYSIGTYNDWRLPTVVQPDATCTDSFDAGGTIGVQSFGGNCTGSEMGHLFYTELGNIFGGFPAPSLGDFQNLLPSDYWSGTEYAAVQGFSWYFRFGTGLQVNNNQFFARYLAMAVRDGDVLVDRVPKPESMLLALTALGSMALVRRRRAFGTSVT